MIEQLATELRALVDGGDAGQIRRRLIQLTHDEDQLDTLTMALELEGGDPELLAILDEARLIRGCAGQVDGLRQAVRRRARARPELVVLPADGSRSAQSLTAWALQMGCPWPVLADEVPSGYLVEPDGSIARETTRDAVVVTREPLIALERGECADTGDAYLVLGWRHGGRWTRAAVPRAAAVSRDGLLRLADRWAPVDQVSATACAAWVSAIDCSAGEHDPRPVLSRMGWTDDGMTFAWGRQAIGDSAIVEVESDESLHWRRSGTWRGWVDGVWLPTRDHPAAIAVLASLCAPLLRVLYAPGWTLDIGQDRGRGKTIAQSAAQSVWADGAALVPWPKTWAAMRNLACLFRDVPTILDDTKTAEGAARDIVDLVYQVAQGRTQVRGAVRGQVEGGELLRTVVISSGEAPIAELPELRAAAGAEHRILTMRERPYPADRRDLVLGVAAAAREHYGWAGPRWVEALQTRRDRWPEWRERYGALVLELGEGRPSDATRIAQRSAQLLLVAELLPSLLGLTVDLDMVRAWVGRTLDVADESDPGRDGLLHVLSSLASRRSQVVGWVEAGEQREPLLATVEHGGLRILSSELDRLLRDGGYRPAEIQRAWMERGWIGRHDRGRMTMRGYVRGQQARMVEFTMAALDAVDGEEGTECLG